MLACADNRIVEHITRRYLSRPTAPLLGPLADRVNSTNSAITVSNFVLGLYRGDRDSSVAAKEISIVAIGHNQTKADKSTLNENELP